MSIILGFGSTEKNQRKIVYDWIFENLKKKFLNREDKVSDSFDENIYNKFKSDFKEYQKKIYAEYEKADTSEKKPERYYHINYGVRIAMNYDTIFVRIKFWHINSRHPFSPDGIALLIYTETFVISAEEFTD